MTATVDAASAYYADKLAALSDLFAPAPVSLAADALIVGERRYPIVDDVIVLLPRPDWPAALARRIAPDFDGPARPPPEGAIARDIQATFGAEWQSFAEIMAEHEGEFRQYFDIVDLDGLAERTICDLGCGIGRWSHFLADRVGRLVLVDFSEAVFVARRNLRGADNALFFMADLDRLPFRDDFCDFAFCLGVLHHLPRDCLDAVRDLRRLAPRLLIYLYSALDARPAHYRWLLRLVNLVRAGASRIRNETARALLTRIGAYGIYYPFIGLGHLLAPFGLGERVPLYDFYRGKSRRRIEQDVYDRFFTRIEQRVSRRQIMALADSFAEITVSDGIPYWHFLCRR